MASPSELQSSFDLGGVGLSSHVLAGKRSLAPRPRPRPASATAGERTAAPSPPEAQIPQEWLTAEEAADYTRLSLRALYQCRQRGQLRGYTVGAGRTLRFRRGDLDALMKPDGRP